MINRYTPSFVLIGWAICLSTIDSTLAQRDFTINDKVIPAEVVEIKPGRIKFRNHFSKKEFVVSIESLSQKDIDYLQRWSMYNVRASELAFDMTVYYRDGRSKIDAPVSAKPEHDAQIDFGHYMLVLTNQSPMAVDDLMIKYVIFEEIKPDGGVLQRDIITTGGRIFNGALGQKQLTKMFTPSIRKEKNRGQKTLGKLFFDENGDPIPSKKRIIARPLMYWFQIIYKGHVIEEIKQLSPDLKRDIHEMPSVTDRSIADVGEKPAWLVEVER